MPDRDHAGPLPHTREIWKRVCPGIDDVLSEFAYKRSAGISYLWLGAPVARVLWRTLEGEFKVDAIAAVRTPYLYLNGSVSRIVLEKEVGQVVNIPGLKLQGRVEDERLRNGLYTVNRALEEARLVLEGRSTKFPVTEIKLTT